MKLFPPDPEIEMYKTGFGETDFFNRKGTGQSLSRLVERIEDPLVIALDGEWGCGKTWFLKRWVGAHQLENEGRATTVYFDAFRHDFMDDPLIALTGVIGDRLPEGEQKQTWEKVKKFAAKFAKPATRITMAALTGGASEAVGPIADAVIEATHKEVEEATAAFWAREDGKRYAMQHLRDSLVDLTHAKEKGEKPVPLVVVVDELDRCRPDYALALLETIKHFFSVPNVHFVLGVNLDALSHSVRARYGSGIDAERYLRRFVPLTMALPNETKGHHLKSVIRAYLQKTAPKMDLSGDIIEELDTHLEVVLRQHVLTMRDINQILSRIALMEPKRINSALVGRRHILISLLILRAVNPKAYGAAVSGKITLSEIWDAYGITAGYDEQTADEGYDHTEAIVSGLWEFILSGGTQPENGKEELSWLIDQYGRRQPHSVLSNVIADYLSEFSISEVV